MQIRPTTYMSSSEAQGVGVTSELNGYRRQYILQSSRQQHQFLSPNCEVNLYDRARTLNFSKYRTAFLSSRELYFGFFGVLLLNIIIDFV